MTRAAGLAVLPEVLGAEDLGVLEHPLISGVELTCPLCERSANVLDYKPLQVSRKYESQVVPPLKCKSCGHVFALRP